MNDNLRQVLAKVGQFIQGLSTTKKVLAAVTLVLVAGILAAVSVIASQDPYQVLYSDLQSEDARSVAKKLGEQGISYKFGVTETTIMVPRSRIAAARMELAKAGLPGQEVVGFEKFDGSTLGMSTYVQRIQYLRAVQGELTRSIERLASVKRARVHISVPPKKTFLEEEDPPKASVVLELKSGQKPTKQEVNGIAHLVASAVEGLKVEEVTIVDNSGNFLHRPEAGNAQGLSSSLLEMQRSIEHDYEKRIEDILTPLIGIDKIRAKVTAEIDPSRINTTEETYDPEKAVARTTIKNDEITQGSRPNPIGIPGSRSNLPGTEVNNPPVPMSNSSTEKNIQNTNYAIPKKIQTIDKPSGSIKRLTVAVVVDGYYNKDSGSTTFAPRGDDELKRLQDLVAHAVGYDAQRRDSITISSLPFKTTELAPVEDTTPQGLNKQEIIRELIKYGLIALSIMLFFFMVIRPILRWATLSEAEKEAALYPKTVAELEAARRDEGVMALSQAANSFEETEPIDKKEEAELMAKIKERLTALPGKGSRVVQDWLDEDQQVLKLEAA